MATQIPARLQKQLERLESEGRGYSLEYDPWNGWRLTHVGRQPKGRQARCGARTRAGGSCLARVVAGRRRCRLHGGAATGPRTAEGRARSRNGRKSTGPTTAEGRERIRESNRRRARVVWDAKISKDGTKLTATRRLDLAAPLA